MAAAPGASAFSASRSPPRLHVDAPGRATPDAHTIDDKKKGKAKSTQHAKRQKRSKTNPTRKACATTAASTHIQGIRTGAAGGDASDHEIPSASSTQEEERERERARTHTQEHNSKQAPSSPPKPERVNTRINGITAAHLVLKPLLPCAHPLMLRSNPERYDNVSPPPPPRAEAMQHHASNATVVVCARSASTSSRLA